jgi:hypothetical protein
MILQPGRCQARQARETQSYEECAGVEELCVGVVLWSVSGQELCARLIEGRSGGLLRPERTPTPLSQGGASRKFLRASLFTFAREFKVIKNFSIIKQLSLRVQTTSKE